MTYDVIIIGGGPAGLTSAIYCQRRQLKTLVIAKAIGGQAALASEVQNWPGEKSIGGFELAQKMHDQAKDLAAEFVSDEVIMIEKSDSGLKVKTNSQEYSAAAVILAFGLTPRDLGVPGEEKFKGRGVSYCATCDGPLFKNKKVAVVGGGNSALEAVEYMSKLATQVYLINNSDKFTGEAELVKQVSALPNVAVDCNNQITEIIGDSKVEKIILADRISKEQKPIDVDGVFVEIGHMPKTGWLKGMVDLNDRGEIVTDKSGMTSAEGIFAAGDCTDVGYKQMIISAGEGAKAALSAYKYIAAKNGGTARPDWGICQKK
ncbi:MAG: FAD-dependent oxidoreductase [Candidatus Buchananbacteria bacterium]